MALRRAYSPTQTPKPEDAQGFLVFDLVTPELDTYNTRLDPMGAVFHSEARPWQDCHDTESCAKTIGEVTEVVEQSPERLRVRVRFDMAKPEAAEVYRQHVEGFVKGCSVGFDPIEWHTEEGQEVCTACDAGVLSGGKSCPSCLGTGYRDSYVMYDKYYVLEGSSCSVPSNPRALLVRTIEDAFQRTAKKPPMTIQTLIFEKADGWTKASAVKWAKDHDYATEVDETSSSFRLRQRDPGGFAEGSLKTVELPNSGGIKAVMGHLKAAERGATAYARAVPLPSPVATEITPFGTNYGVRAAMKPEHRAHHRYMMGDHMRLAEDHLGMHSAMEHPEHRKFHREAAMGCMRAASTCMRMIADSMAEGHEDAPQDAALVGSMMRKAPEGADADLATQWDACQRACLPYAGRTFGDVARSAGAKDPDELAQVMATQKTIAAKYTAEVRKQAAAARATEESERLRLVQQLAASEAGLEPGLEAEIMGCDPVGYVRGAKENIRKGTPWTLDMIRRHQTEVEGVVAQVTRTAPLHDAKTGATVPGALKQGEVDRTQIRTGLNFEAEAKGAGVKPETVSRAAAFFQRSL